MSVTRSEAAATNEAASAVTLGVRDIQVRFAGVVAVDGVCIEARRGEVLGLIGPKGQARPGGFGTYSKRCDEVTRAGYAGFRLGRSARRDGVRRL
jgi:hypothetical protein